MNLIYSGQYKPIIGKSVFLAGCSPRKGQILNWRKDAIDILLKWNHNGEQDIETIIIPEPETGESSDYNSVINWEITYMNYSDYVLFWVPRSISNQIYGFTTNIEFGKCIGLNKPFVYGRPDDSDNNRYLDAVYEIHTGSKPSNTLDDLIYDLYDDLIWK